MVLWQLVDKDTKGNTHISTTSKGSLDVIPDTVGQFTGLTDKNGKEIYEGDIYRYDNPDSINEVSYCAGGGFAGFDLTPAKHNENRLLDVEVIGNIHDNPELLKNRNTMTRKEEIEKAAMQVAGIHPDWSKLDCFRMGFREGANFADKTMLDRVCEWLSIYYPNIDRMGIDEFINAFRQAMKGGAE